MQSEIDSLRAEIKKLKKENQILQEDAAFKPIFHNSPIGIFRSTLDGKFLKANQTFCDILRYKNPEELYSSVSDITKQVYANKEDRQKVIDKLNKDGEYTYYELNFKRKNGEVFTGLVSLRLVKDEKGNNKYLEGTAEDVSKFKKAELDLKSTENLYQTLINTISDTIVISEISGEIKFVSPSVLKLTSSDKMEDIIGTNLLEWVQPEHHYKAKENIHKILNNLPYNNEEYKMRRGDGSSFFAEIRSTVISDDDGKPSKLISIIQDITERKATESVLRQTQDLYRTIIELSPAGILIINNDEIIFLNKTTADIFDTNNQWDLIGKSLNKYISKDHKAAFNKLIKTVNSKEQSEHAGEFQLRSLENVMKDVKVMASPIFYDGRDCVFLFLNDVTKKVMMEKELNRDRHMMETFYNHIPDSITFKNRKGQYIKVNETFKKWVKIKKDRDVINLTDKEIFSKSHFTNALEEEKKVVEKGEIIVNQVQKESWPDNKNKWVSLTKMPLYDLDKNIIGVFSLTKDITQEYNARLEIRDRERWFRNIFDHSPVAKIIITPTFKVKRVNQTLVDLLDIDIEEYIGKSVFKFFESEGRVALRNLFKEKLNTVDTNKFQLETSIKKGAKSFINVLLQGVYLVDSEDEQGEFLINLVDIHKRKLAEDLLMVRNNELNNFVYKVSHDLRAPLTSIKGIINLIQLEKDPEVFHQYIQMISERIERLDHFIRDVLSHSRNLNVEIKFEPIDLQKLIDECVSNVIYQDSKLNVKKSISIKGKPFYSDYQRVHEIMRNLISNAFQYSKKDSTNAYVKIETKTTQKYTRIIVEDNGVGIKRKFQKHIFDMFYRANEKVEGSGLGLYIVKLSVEKLNGEIKLSSTYNKGTKFEIILPNNRPK